MSCSWGPWSFSVITMGKLCWAWICIHEAAHYTVITTVIQHWCHHHQPPTASTPQHCTVICNGSEVWLFSVENILSLFLAVGGRRVEVPPMLQWVDTSLICHPMFCVHHHHRTMQLSCSHPQRGVGHRNICSTSSRVVSTLSFSWRTINSIIVIKSSKIFCTSMIFDVCKPASLLRWLVCKL